ncbi:hypothetical protein [Nitrospira sp. BLG_2]|uniref:hypothetical protein n=1 Tax=Nitrospira sp. BLG_2 TaxID=3397507 RepID=UPI003B9B071F
MKHPNLRHLKINRDGTDSIRNALRKKGRSPSPSILTQPICCVPTTRSKKVRIPYQRLVKTLLSTTVSQQESL